MLFATDCIFDEGSELIGDFDFNENEYPVMLIASADTINIDEPFTVEVNLPILMKDNSGVEHAILDAPNLTIGFKYLEKVEPLEKTNMVMSENLYKKIDQYLSQDVKIGSSDGELPLRYETALIDNKYQLKIEFTVKQKGIYLVEIEHNENKIMVEDILGFDGIDFKQPKFCWKENPINQVVEYYSDEFDQSNKFVFEVN